MSKPKPSKLAKKDVMLLEQQVGELTEALKRERADAINVRRRSEEERAKLGSFYKSMIVRELLPAVDNLERALKHVPKGIEDSDFAKGVQSVLKQFEKSLSDIGVERVKTVGEPFDPKYHEAVSMDDGDGDHEVVSEELQAGYRIGDAIIRHAMVKVKMGKRQ